jgi:hypothetical protein
MIVRRDALVAVGMTLLIPQAVAVAAPMSWRPATTVERFAARTTQHFLRTYAGEAAALPVSRCTKAAGGLWRCRVSVNGGECVVNLKILDEGPVGPPLYVLNLQARCDE